MNNNLIVTATDDWLREFVVHYGLCPFAAKVLTLNQLHYQVSEADNEADLINDFLVLAQQLVGTDRGTIETALLIHPKVLVDFYQYNDFLSIIDEVLVASSLAGVLQVASFHPDYIFAESEKDDPGNFSNRSPYPMLHLLREESITEAVEQWQRRGLDTSSVPNNNIKLLAKIGADALHRQLAGYLKREK